MKTSSNLVKLFGLMLLLAGHAAHSADERFEPWVHDPVISDVAVTKDGNRLLAVTLPNMNAVPELTVWRTADLAAPPLRWKPGSSKIIAAFWISNSKAVVVGRQKFDIRAGGKPTRTFRNLVYMLDTDCKKKCKGKSILSTREDVINVSLASTLPANDSTVLLEVLNDQFVEEFVELDLNRNTTRRVFRGSDKYDYDVDAEGRVVIRYRLHGTGSDTRLSVGMRADANEKWEDHFSIRAVDRAGIQFGGIQIASDGTVYVQENAGREFTVVRTYDPGTRKLSEPLYSNPEYDIASVILRRNKSTDPSRLVGYVIHGPMFETVYTDKFWRELQGRVDQALPGYRNNIRSWSDDMSIVVIDSQSPKEAGLYSLLVNGSQLVSLGRERPALKPEAMANMSFVGYQARDGLNIPGILTIPSKGTKPFPAIVLPHGGPWARDYLTFDPWAQFLADRGYVVLQPQYRGSEGWGQTLWRAGDSEWGQKMQDDKDDGARWLVEQGYTTADRIAIFGYSYGGYAAMAAIVRPNSPYQCAIAGAGLAELASFRKETSRGEFIRNYQKPTIYGLSPIEAVSRANIPALIFHGDRDQIVPVGQSRKFVRALKGAGKTVEYLEIPDLWHSNPWFPTHRLAMFERLEDYLANRCGPGGL